MSQMLSCCGVFYYIGAAAVIVFAARVLSWIHEYFLSATSIRHKYAKAGAWAVVTGASDGIGAAFSIELAKRGMNVCLVSRTQSKLDAVAQEIASKTKVQTKTIAFDFSTADDAAYKKLFKQLDQIEIGVLVNNVGINYEFPHGYEELPVDVDLSILKVNCESQLQMTKYVLPKMKEKRCGGILSLSSLSCRVHAPMLATYAATKSFNKTFSEALSVEARPYNVDVTCVSPGMVVSKMSGRKKPAFDCPSAAAMAKQTLNKLGATSLTWGHINHGIMGAVLDAVPAMIMDGYILGLHKTVQKKALKKKEREAAAAQK